MAPPDYCSNDYELLKTELLLPVLNPLKGRGVKWLHFAIQF